MARWFLLLALAAGAPAPLLFGQGSLTPPGPPAPTMKTLAQIEPRTPISSVPFTISVSGSYYLTGNLTVSGGNASTIAVDGVTLDLNGFTIASTAPIATGFGIRINDGRRNVAILNGFIKGGVVNEQGVYSGSGFGYGIYGSSLINVRVSGVSVLGCLYYGIYLGTDSTVVEYCTVQTVGSYGILASTIKTSVARECGGFAIFGNQVSDCRGECTGSAYGLYAMEAQNCSGSSSSGYGLFADTALNCYGSSSSGYGLFADTALNCYGYSSGSTGLSADTAQNCYGYSSGAGYGIYAVDIAIGCRGYSSSGTGLNAYIANSCRGTTTSGTAQNITYKYNMP